jgi:hypothetical protein
MKKAKTKHLARAGAAPRHRPRGGDAVEIHSSPHKEETPRKNKVGLQTGPNQPFDSKAKHVR